MRALIVGFAVVAFLCVAGPARADEEKVPLEKVPKAVMETVKKRFPDAKIVEASTEKEDGKTVYEITVKDGGKNVDVTLTADGVMTLIEKEIDAKDVPKVVTEAVEAKYPKATW